VGVRVGGRFVGVRVGRRFVGVRVGVQIFFWINRYIDETISVNIFF